MNNSPPVGKSRRRSRQLHFDLNRSTPNTDKNIPKLSTPQEVGENMSQQKEGQIRDLSRTIIANTANRPQEGAPSEFLNQGSSGLAAGEGMELSLRRLVDQSVGSQMADMKRMIADLTSTVGKLSLVVHQTQQEHKKIVENNMPSTSKASKDSQEEVSMDDLAGGSDHSSRASSVNHRYRYVNENRPRVDKWGLEFDGDSNKLAVEDFVFRLERLQSQYRVPWNEVLDNFHLLVKGPAEKWYWLFVQTNYVTEWDTLKQALLKQYQTSRSSFELMRDMVERRQQPGETIDEFFFAMTQLRSRLTISMPEAEMVKMLKRNVRENVGRIVYPMPVSSVEELRMSCLDAEKTFLKRDSRQQQPPNYRYVRQVNELYDEPTENPNSEDLVEVAEIGPRKADNPQTRQLICWNCHQNGHVFMDCTSNERTIFCFKCGKPEVTAPTCSNCRSRNFRWNDGRAGNHRSITDPQVKN